MADKTSVPAPQTLLFMGMAKFLRCLAGLEAAVAPRASGGSASSRLDLTRGLRARLASMADMPMRVLDATRMSSRRSSTNCGCLVLFFLRLLVARGVNSGIDAPSLAFAALLSVPPPPGLSLGSSAGLAAGSSISAGATSTTASLAPAATSQHARYSPHRSIQPEKPRPGPMDRVRAVGLGEKSD